MSWDYRVTKDKNGFTIREVYYEKGEIFGWLQDAPYPWGKTREELEKDFNFMKKAFEYTTIDLAEIENKEKP